VERIKIVGYESSSAIVKTNGICYNIDIGETRLSSKLFATRDIENCNGFGELLNLCLNRGWLPVLNREKGVHQWLS